jgi:hypothetical protein
MNIITSLICSSPFIILLLWWFIEWLIDSDIFRFSKNSKVKFSAKKARKKTKKKEKKIIYEIVDTCLRIVEEQSNEGGYEVSVPMRKYYSNTVIGGAITKLVNKGYTIKYDSSEDGHINSITIFWHVKK